MLCCASLWVNHSTNHCKVGNQSINQNMQPTLLLTLHVCRLLTECGGLPSG
jgi:hypothetical protein